MRDEGWPSGVETPPYAHKLPAAFLLGDAGEWFGSGSKTWDRDMRDEGWPNGVETPSYARKLPAAFLFGGCQ